MKKMLGRVLAVTWIGCCGLGHAWAQDIVVPGMPNVDTFRSTPEFSGDRLAIARYLVLSALCGEIASMEVEIQKKNVDISVLIKRVIELLPVTIADECPEDFRKGCIVPLENMKTALDANPGWLHTLEGKGAMREMENALLYVAEKYDLLNVIKSPTSWIRSQGPEEEGRKEHLERLPRLKADLESGKMAVPDELIKGGSNLEMDDV